MRQRPAPETLEQAMLELRLAIRDPRSMRTHEALAAIRALAPPDDFLRAVNEADSQANADTNVIPFPFYK
jgi:hypothetical protein